MAMQLSFSVGDPVRDRVMDALEKVWGRESGESDQAMIERCIIHRVCHLVYQHEQKEAAGEVEFEPDLIEVA